MAVALLAGCEDGGTGPGEFNVADLAGSWDATELSVTSKADPALSVRLIEGGGAVHWAIQPSGAFLGTAVVPGVLLELPNIGVVTVPLSGRIRLLDPSTLRLDFIPEIPPMFTTVDGSFTLTGNTLTLVDEDAEYDFNLGGSDEPAVLRAVLVRR